MQIKMCMNFFFWRIFKILELLDSCRGYTLIYNRWCELHSLNSLVMRWMTISSFKFIANKKAWINFFDKWIDFAKIPEPVPNYFVRLFLLRSLFFSSQCCLYTIVSRIFNIFVIYKKYIHLPIINIYTDQLIYIYIYI